MKHRRGWMLLESIVSVALLSVAAVAAVRLAGTQRAHREMSRQTLAANIACDNAAEWLRGGTVESLADDIQRLSELPLGEGLRFEVAPFGSAGFTGVHVRITPQVQQQAVVTRDFWRLRAADEADPADEANAADPSADEATGTGEGNEDAS